MKRFLKLYLCKFLIFSLVTFSSIEVYPKKYEKIYKNYNNKKFIDTRENSDLDKFFIKNIRSNFISKFSKKRGKFFVRINQIFLFIILIIIFITVFEI